MADSACPFVLNTTQATFMSDVFERSKTTLVVVDFWAEWCQPCRALGPVLEQLAVEFAGKFVLVKAETEQVPQAMADFNVEGIPAVYAVAGGQIVDYFVGALPRDQVRGWLERLLTADEVRQTEQLEATDPVAAEAAYRRLAMSLPNEPAVRIGLARVLISQNRNAEAAAIIEQLERRGFLEPEAEKVKAALDLRSNSTRSVDACRQAVAEAPNDVTLQLELGEALAAAQSYEEALNVLLGVVQKDRASLRERARQLMVDIFRVLPSDSEVTRTYRRKLSSALY